MVARGDALHPFGLASLCGRALSLCRIRVRRMVALGDALHPFGLASLCGRALSFSRKAGRWMVARGDALRPFGLASLCGRALSFCPWRGSCPFLPVAGELTLPAGLSLARGTAVIPNCPGKGSGPLRLRR